MAVKRVRLEDENTATMADKRVRVEEENTADRLTSLPESLQLHILSSIETIYAFQTSKLSKSWVSTWTYNPILNFTSYRFKKLIDFDKFVSDTLSLRGSMKLDTLTFKRDGNCSAKILNKVFSYAFSHGVKELEASIHQTRKGSCCNWPIRSHTSSDSLTSLKLKSDHSMVCSFLGLRSGSFKSLTYLHLERAIITDPDPFSGFPGLQKLKLVNFHLLTHENTLNIQAPQLLKLTISNYFQYVYHCELATPKLKYFEYKGRSFPKLKTHKDGLHVLDTVIIDFCGLYYKSQEKKVFDDLLMFFCSFYNARSLIVSSSIVLLLSLFPDELVYQCSPFADLKCLKLDFSMFHNQNLFDDGLRRSLDGVLTLLVPGVKDYLIQKSHDAKWMIIYPTDESNAKSSAQKYECLQSNAIKRAIRVRVRSRQK